ncbi:type VII secretion protein EssA [Peribacillus kribbensis]|uniref:type VII secretion protein EssA n=1 Tax=Peribacillus kribbensis TaxID=356658 RepID=UPI00040A9F77|nr:type VII secretion protein EssA [Peribacillus kribbensis]
MKYRRYFLLPVLCLGILLAGTGTGDAQEHADVKPNTYKDKNIKLNTDYFHEDSLLKEKAVLPDEQKMLTFKKKKNTLISNVERKLFISSEHQTTAAGVKAEQLNLFTDPNLNSAPIYKDPSSSDKEENKLYLPLIFGVLLIMIILFMFLVLVPRISKELKKTS